MDTHRDNPSRHPTAALFASLGNPPTTPLPPLPPLIPFIPQSPVSQPSPTSELVDTQTHRYLREEVTPLFRTWEPTPENISELLRCSNVRFPQSDDVPSDDGIQQPSSSTSSEFSTLPQSKRQSHLQASLTVPTFASAAITGPCSLTSQLSAPTEQTEANKSKSSFFKLVQPIPPQSRTFFKNVPFLHRLSYAGSVDLCGSSSGNSSPRTKTTVDPFDSDRDVLSKVYILTTSAHGAANLAHLSGQQQQQQQQQQLPPKYLLKVFPDKTPFKHAATRADPINSYDKSSSSSQAVLKTIIQDAIEHELGAIEWAQKFLRRTNTPNVLGYSLPFDCPTQLPGGNGEGEGAEITGVERYGILGFILMEFPAEGILYQGPLEEFQSKETQGVEVGEGFAEILYEMRSASCSTRVAGFSIHRRIPADDGSSKVVDRVSKPYNRFDLIVDELRRKDAERVIEKLSLNLLDTATVQPPSTPSFTDSGTRETFQHKSDHNDTNKCQADSGGADAADDAPYSNSTMTSQSSSSASSFSAPASALSQPSLASVKDPKRLSLLMHVHKKTIERKMSAGEIPETPLYMPSLAPPSVPVGTTTTVPTVATTATADNSQANIVDLEVDRPVPPRQIDATRQETPQDDLLQTIAKRLVKTSPPPSDALEACRRMSQSEKHHHPQSTASASLASLEMLAAGTMRRVMESKKPKLSIRPSSTISVAGCLRIAPYTRSPLKASPPKTWPDVRFPSKATVVRRQPVTRRVSCCFDADASVYCSSRAQERYVDGRGEVSRLVTKISGDLAFASLDPLTTSTETKNLSWPKNFIEPANFKDGKPVYNSVADYEYARLVNALVALERLDSTPGSTNRFPKELITLLPRILRLVHQKDILFSHTPRMSQKRSGDRGKQSPIAITNAATQAAIFTPPSPPGLFEGIESVFTHGQLAAQGSLVTDRRRRDVVAVANFQKAGFLPPYEEDMRGLFVKKVYSSFWNVSTASGDNTLEYEGGRGGGVEKGQAGREGKAQSRMQKTASKVWPFKRSSKLSTFTTTSSPDTIPLKPFDEVDEGDNEYNVHVPAQLTMPARSISIHGKHPVPYPLLNHAIEDGSSCGNRYMVLVEASSPMLSTSTSPSLASSLSTDSLATDSSLAHGLEASKRFSVASPGLALCQTAPAPPVATSASDTLAEEAVVESNGSFRRMKSQFKARFVSKFQKNKDRNKNMHDNDNDDDDEKDPGWVMIEELIQDPAVSDDLFPLSSITDAATATTATKAIESGPPALECFPSSSSASALLPSPPPQRPLMAELPTFHTAPSSLSLSLSIPRSGNSARSTTSQGTLLPEEPKICKIGWGHFLKTYCALETKALKAAAAAAAAASDGANINDHTYTGASNQNATINSPPPSTCLTPISFAFSTIKFKESTYFHNHQLRSLTDTINNRSNSMLALESLISLSKTLQNLVVALEAGGIVLTPEQLLMVISGRQQEWQRNEDKRLAQIENDKEHARELRIQAGERQEREQEEKMAEFERQKQQLEQQEQEQKKQLEEKQQQGQQGQQKGKQQWRQDDEIRGIPPEVPPKGDPPPVPPKDNNTVLSSSCADTDTDTGAGVGSAAQAGLFQSKSPRFSMLKAPSFLSKQRSVAESALTTPAALVARRISHLFGISPQSQSSLSTSSSVSEGPTACTGSAYHYHGRTPEYFIRSPDDDILYSAPGLQRDPLSSELPDHIQHSSTVTTTGSTFVSGTSPFDSTVVYDTDLHHRLGTMIAPSLPAYGIRLTNPDGTKTLAQVEAERIEREMQTFWRELEALCEHEGQTSWRAPPGIALLSIAELEKQLKDVERYVTETKQGRRSRLL
ncbi:hypothetical protein BGZ47_009118 [Haplosporangium gracile]|nr:hypothetical protein BGZ47_009118 [Haplosporangium gracile]